MPKGRELEGGEPHPASAVVGVTVAANPEVTPYQNRHGAIVQRQSVMQWLDGSVREAELLATPPARMFTVEELTAFAGQHILSRQ